MKASNPNRNDYQAKKKIINKYGEVIFVCAIDKDGIPHLTSIGFPSKAEEELYKHMKFVSELVCHSFAEGKLKKNKPHILKFFIRNDIIVVHYFKSVPSIPSLKLVV